MVWRRRLVASLVGLVRGVYRDNRRLGCLNASSDFQTVLTDLNQYKSEKTIIAKDASERPSHSHEQT